MYLPCVLLLQRPSTVAVILMGALLCAQWVPTHQQTPSTQTPAATTAASNSGSADSTPTAATTAAPAPAAQQPAAARKKSKIVEMAPEADLQNDVDDISAKDGTLVTKQASPLYSIAATVVQ